MAQGPSANSERDETMKTKVKILSEANGVTRVTETSGARRGEDLFVARSGLGNIGDTIELPEFQVEESGPTVHAYYAEPASETIKRLCAYVAKLEKELQTLKGTKP